MKPLPKRKRLLLQKLREQAVRLREQVIGSVGLAGGGSTDTPETGKVTSSHKVVTPSAGMKPVDPKRERRWRRKL